MSTLVEYTIEIYKADKRIKRDDRYGKNKAGLRFVEVMDYAPSTKDYIMGGKEFKERYDTPHYCSPSSEAYYSM